jgi:hypothetical protein
MKTRWWELLAGLGSLLLALKFAMDGRLVRFVLAALVFLSIARRVLPRYAVFFFFAHRALRRWRLGPKAMLTTSALGVRMNRLFTPGVAAGRLRHGRTRCGWGYGLFVPIVREAATAQRALQQLSFYDTGDTLALAQPLRSLRELGTQLDRIDESLIRSAGGAVGDELRLTTAGAPSGGSLDWSAAAAVQSRLENTLARRSGADGEWFHRVVAKRGEVVSALREGHSTMRRMKQKALWMRERQREQGSGDEVESIDVTAARGELREAGRLVTTLAEGVGEVHLGTATRL